MNAVEQERKQLGRSTRELFIKMRLKMKGQESIWVCYDWKLMIL